MKEYQIYKRDGSHQYSEGTTVNNLEDLAKYVKGFFKKGSVGNELIITLAKETKRVRKSNVSS
jgi:hypothetical protein